MKVSFNITKLFATKPKSVQAKTKAPASIQAKKPVEKDSWGMSPEAALRVTYTGYK